MPIIQGMVEVVNEVIFDSELLRAGPSLPLFVNPLGAVIPGTQTRKMRRDTNMWINGQIPSPQRFLVKGILCVFLDPTDNVVPITDAMYWAVTLDFCVNQKIYWHSPVAYVVDPIILTTPEQWAGLSMDKKRALERRFSNQLISPFVPADRILVRSFPENEKAGIHIPEIDGVLIEQQQPFGVRIHHDGQWPDYRIVCALSGTMLRPVM